MVLVKFRKVSDLSTRRRAMPPEEETVEQCRKKRVYGKYQDGGLGLWGLEHVCKRLLDRWTIIRSGHQLEIHARS